MGKKILICLVFIRTNIINLTICLCDQLVLCCLLALEKRLRPENGKIEMYFAAHLD